MDPMTDAAPNEGADDPAVLAAEEQEEAAPLDPPEPEPAEEPDVLNPTRHQTRQRDGRYSAAETVLERGPRTGASATVEEQRHQFIDDRAMLEAATAQIAATKAARRTQATVTESVALSEAQTDRSKREVLLRIIKPGFGSSRDPKSGLPVYYTEAALREAAAGGIFTGKKCFLNHATAAERKARPEGDITRWGATIKHAWWDEGQKAPVGRTRVVNSALWEAIELDPDEVAVSIHAHGTGHVGKAEGRDAWLCEHIDRCHSVDFVTYPGAGGGVVRILESDREAVRFSEVEQREAERDMLEDITETDLRDARPDLVAAIARSTQQTASAADLTEALRPYEERMRLLESELNSRDARALVEHALGACGLPGPAAQRLRGRFDGVTFGLEDSLYSTPQELVEAVGEAATAEAEYIKSLAVETKRAITGMGTAAPLTESAPGGTSTRGTVDRTLLHEAQRTMDTLLGAKPARGTTSKEQGAVGTAHLQGQLDALLTSGRRG